MRRMVVLGVAAACGSGTPPPKVSTTERWERVVALAETECDEWPEDEFRTDIAPAERRQLLRSWHAANPTDAVDVDARYVTFTYVDRTEAEDVPVLAHLVGSLRQCGIWADQHAEDELVLRACAVEPSMARQAFPPLTPPPTLQVYAARESAYIVEVEAPSVSGRFTASLLVGTQEWLAKWVLDGEGVMPPIPPNLPFAAVLAEDTRPVDPAVAEAVSRCVSAPDVGAFRVPRPNVAGVLRPDPAGYRLWWPDDGTFGAEGTLGPVDVWDGGATPAGRVTVGALTRVEHCPGRFHLEAVVPLGEGGAPSEAPRVASSPGASGTGWSVGRDECGEVVTGPKSTWSLGCCP